MLKYTYSLLVFFIFSCNWKSNDAVIENKSIDSNAFNESEKQNEVDKLRLLGIWTNSTSENAVFDIRKDSIYYVDQFNAYKYYLKGDSIKIYYPDEVFTGKIELSNDTLIIDSKNGAEKYWKFID